MNVYRAAMAVVILGSLCAAARAAEFSLPLAADATINGNAATTNYGAATALTVHSFGPKFGLVRFDAAAIAGQTVTQATLRIYLRTIVASGQLTVYPLVSSWNEGTVTWNLQPPSEATATANVALTTAMAGTVISINVTSVAQRWANGTLPAAGFLLSTLNGIKATIDSKELAGGTRATLDVITQDGPPPQQSFPAVVLDLSQIPVVISQQGLYVLNRNWLINSANENSHVIEIRTTGVQIDLRGFTIDSETAPTQHRMSVIACLAGALGVTIKNGAIISTNSHAIDCPVTESVLVENMEIRGFSQIAVGQYSTVRDSLLLAGRITAGTSSVVMNNALHCDEISGSCIRAFDNVQILNNKIAVGMNEIIGAAAIVLLGSGSVVSDNTLTGNFHIDSDESVYGIIVSGDRNVVSNNTVRTSQAGYAIQVNGTANVLSGNLGIGLGTGVLASGIFFTRSGNFYGRNTMSATAPFSLNGTTQTDLGGNVGF